MSVLKVGIVMGSDSDLDTMKDAAAVLNELGVANEMRVMSAHRSPELSGEFAKNAINNGFGVIIAGAGGAAHLAGAISAHTTLPVIGIPIATAPLNGFDSLLATVQMPPGIPVATVSVGKWGGRNAGILAAQILALSDKDLAQKLVTFKEKLAKGVEEKNKKLQEKLGA